MANNIHAKSVYTRAVHQTRNSNELPTPFKCVRPSKGIDGIIRKMRVNGVMTYVVFRSRASVLRSEILGFEAMAGSDINKKRIHDTSVPCVVTPSQLARGTENSIQRGYVCGLCKDGNINTEAMLKHFYAYVWDAQKGEWKLLPGIYVRNANGGFMLLDKTESWFHFQPRRINNRNCVRALIMYIVECATLKEIYFETGVTPNKVYSLLHTFIKTGKIGRRTFLKSKEFVRFCDLINAVRNHKGWKYKRIYSSAPYQAARLRNVYHVVCKALVGVSYMASAFRRTTRNNANTTENNETEE